MYRSYKISAIVLVVAVALLGLDAHQRQLTREDELRTRFETSVDHLNHVLTKAGDHIDVLREVARHELLTDHGHDRNSRLYNRIQPSAYFDGYALDTLAAEPGFFRSGNLTGAGQLDLGDTPLRRELMMALRLNSFFMSAAGAVPFVERVYYLSRRRFEISYPWVSSLEHHFRDETFRRIAAASGSPDAIPGRTRFWVQDDNSVAEAWERPMATLAGGVELDGRFMGIIAVDLSLQAMVQSLDDDFPLAGRLLILDRGQQVLAQATTGRIEPLQPEGQSLQLSNKELANFFPEAASRSDGGLLVLEQDLIGSPWRLVLAVSEGQLILETLKDMWAELGALLLLIYLLFTIERRRRISYALQTSEAKLRSHVADLEDSKRRVEALMAEMARESERQKTRERQLSEAQRIARLGDWRWDVEEQTVECSAELARILGLGEERKAVFFEDLKRRVHPQDRETYLGTLKTTYQEKSTCDFSIRILLDDGTEHFVWLDGKCELDPEGEVTALYGVCQDISVQKATEMALIQALNNAKEANQAKSDFLASMSHELRTPLNAIIGFGQVITGELFGSIGNTRYREYASDILASGEHLLDIIDDLLDLSKIEAGEFALHEEDLDLVELARDVIKLMGPQSNKLDITLTLQALQDEIWVHADRRTLRQIMMNLLSNAIKFSNSGDVAILEVEDIGGEGIALTVRDTGIGIEQEDLGRVMQPFGQVANPLSRNHPGTGLGLPIVKALVKLHGGRFEIDSALGLGTTVKAIFPPERRVTARLDRVS